MVTHSMKNIFRRKLNKIELQMNVKNCAMFFTQKKVEPLLQKNVKNARCFFLNIIFHFSVRSKIVYGRALSNTLV